MGHWADPRSPEGLARVLRGLELVPSHRWGQNFLVDPDVFRAMGDLVMNGRSSAPVLEIGPGVGGLTHSLLERGAFVAAVELDQRVKPILDDLGAQYPERFTVYYQDALEGSWGAIARQCGLSGMDVAGNLPYYATAPLLGRLLETDLLWDRAVFMVQREVAERLLTKPGSRRTSTLGVLLRYSLDIDPGIDLVPPASFFPAPEVSSAVIQLRRRPPLPVDWHQFRWVVRAGFQHRRKMLRQALPRAIGSPLGRDQWIDLLADLNISQSARAEELTLEEWERLAAALKHRKKGTGSHDL